MPCCAGNPLLNKLKMEQESCLSELSCLTQSLSVLACAKIKKDSRWCWDKYDKEEENVKSVRVWLLPRAWPPAAGTSQANQTHTVSTAWWLKMTDLGCHYWLVGWCYRLADAGERFYNQRLGKNRHRWGGSDTPLSRVFKCKCWATVFVQEGHFLPALWLDGGWADATVPHSGDS